MSNRSGVAIRTNLGHGSCDDSKWIGESGSSPTSINEDGESFEKSNGQPHLKFRGIVGAVGKIASTLALPKRDPSGGAGLDNTDIVNPSESRGNSLRKKSTGGSNGSELTRRGTSDSTGLDGLSSRGSSRLRLGTSKLTLEPDIRRASEFEIEAVSPGLPPFSLKPYGMDWYRDNCHLLTNAIRREVMDLYVILRSMHERQDCLKQGDIRSFFVWINTFADFFNFSMDLLENALIPWVERSQEIPDDEYLESLGGRMKVGKDCLKTVDRLVVHTNDFSQMAPRSAYKKIYRVLQKWIGSLFGYIDSLDEGAAEIIQASCEPDECLNFHRWIARQAIESRHKDTNIVLLVRFLDARPKTLAEWRNTNLNPLELSAHPHQWRALAKKHFEVVAYFRRCTPSLASASKKRGK